MDDIDPAGRPLRMYHARMSESRAAAVSCHLVVADLFPAAAAPYRGIALPALEQLLARGDLSPLEGASLERWLAATFRVTAGDDLPLAAPSLRGDGVAPGDAFWLQADPVHLKVDRDRVLLADASCFEIDAGEAAALVGALNGHFGADGLEFVAPVPQRWYARTRDAPRIRTTPTPEICGRGIEGFLPMGEDGARWRRIGNEAQMLLHGHPCNEAREARGTLPVNGVWFWGAGAMAALPGDTSYSAVWTSHPLAAGLAAGAGLPVQASPSSGEAWLKLARPTDKPHLVVLHGLRDALGSGIEAWRNALEALESLWIAPLVAALGHGAVRELVLHALGPERACVATATRFSPFRFWRRRRPLEHYAS